MSDNQIEHRSYLLEIYKYYTELTKFWIKLIITSNGVYFAITGTVFAIALRERASFGPYFIYTLLLPIIISISFIYFGLSARDGSKDLQDTIRELQGKLELKVGPYVSMLRGLLVFMSGIHFLIIVMLVIFIFSLATSAPALQPANE